MVLGSIFLVFQYVIAW